MRGMRIYCACALLHRACCLQASVPLLTIVDLCFRRSWALECGCVVVFTIEFVGRLLSCPDLRKFAGDFLNWIDLMAILPFYIEEAVQSVHISLAPLSSVISL